MTESRHVASLVATHGLPGDMDLIIETLQTADGVRVNRIDGHYADIVVDDTEVVYENTAGTGRTFLVHPDGTGEIYNLQRVEEANLPEFFSQFTLPEDDSWQDVAARWLFYDATHLSEEQIDEVLETHNEDCERMLEHGDFIGFAPFIRNSLSRGEK